MLNQVRGRRRGKLPGTWRSTQRAGIIKTPAPNTYPCSSSSASSLDYSLACSENRCSLTTRGIDSPHTKPPQHGCQLSVLNRRTPSLPTLSTPLSPLSRQRKCRRLRSLTHGEELVPATQTPRWQFFRVNPFWPRMTRNAIAEKIVVRQPVTHHNFQPASYTVSTNRLGWLDAFLFASIRPKLCVIFDFESIQWDIMAAALHSLCTRLHRHSEGDGG